MSPNSLDKHFQIYMYVVMLFIRRKKNDFIKQEEKKKISVEYVINANVLYVKPK